MPKLIPLEEFIEINLSKNCVNMVGHIQEKQLIPVIGSYLATQNEHSFQSLLTLRVKLFDYYSCMRNFDFCNLIQSEISYQLQSVTFQNDKIKAQYLISMGYQHRNYEPTKNFELSEQNFKDSEALSLNLINTIETPEIEKQECIDLLFNAKISRFWLYANYIKDMGKAKETLEELKKLFDKTSVPAYRLAYAFFVGSYFIKNKEYNSAVDTLSKAEEEKSCDETKWFFDRLTPLIKEQLNIAQKEFSENLKDHYKFFPQITNSLPNN